MSAFFAMMNFMHSATGKFEWNVLFTNVEMLKYTAITVHTKQTIQFNVWRK